MNNKDLIIKMKDLISELNMNRQPYEIVTTEDSDPFVVPQMVLSVIISSLERGDKDWKWLEGYLTLNRQYIIKGFDEKLNNRFLGLIQETLDHVRKECNAQLH